MLKMFRRKAAPTEPATAGGVTSGGAADGAVQPQTPGQRPVPAPSEPNHRA
jgi:hypothetical protein